jgi:hypothetical protein
VLVGNGRNNAGWESLCELVMQEEKVLEAATNSDGRGLEGRKFGLEGCG